MSDLPVPPYYAVIFTSELVADATGYAAAAQRMEALASKQPGYLGIHSAREGGHGITVSYWRDEAAIRGWREQAEHLMTQQAGRSKWYERYTVEVSRVERCYAFTRED